MTDAVSGQTPPLGSLIFLRDQPLSGAAPDNARGKTPVL